MSSDRFTFLAEKAENFRTFLLGQSPDQTVLNQIEGFGPDMLIPTLTTVLLPTIHTLGKEHVLNQLLSHLTPADPAAVRVKIERYLDCFCEVLSTK